MITDRFRTGTSLGLEADPYGPRGSRVPRTTTGPDMQIGLDTASPTPTISSKPIPPAAGPTTPTVGTTNLPPGTPMPKPVVTRPGGGSTTTPGIPAGPGGNRPGSGAGSSAPYTPAGMDAGRRVTSNELVSNQLNALLGSNSTYMRNARQRGIEYAGSRGLVNSSIASGAAARAAIEAGLPIAQADADAYRSAGDQTYAALTSLRNIRAQGDISNWLADEAFNREFNGALAMLPVRSSMDMLTYTLQRGMDDPAVYTPDVLSGFNNFFNQNMFDIMSRYYGTGGTTPGGG